MGKDVPATVQEPVYHSRGRFVLGCTLAAVLLAGLAEVFLCWFPPKDLQPYLGEASPLAGIYRPDPNFSITYRSWEAFCNDNAERLRLFGPFAGSPDGRPIWAFFGNSFVQAPGMLADHVRVLVPDRRVFNLGRNEPLYLQLAQIQLLVESGLEPERIFVVLMPVDVIELGQKPLATHRVTAQGALTYQPRQPAGPVGWLIGHSRLALTAWVRGGWQRGNPDFRSTTVYEGVGEPLLGDLCWLFGNLARFVRARHIPVTVILIPAYHQIRYGASCGFQNDVGAMLRQQGYDVLDLRDSFRRQPDLDELFLPDKHFTPLGNWVLLAALLDHVHGQESLTRAGKEGDKP
jgi:hypothetical protein